VNDPAALAPTAARPPRGFLDRTFRLSERASSVIQELVAGATTFAAMAYILAVNPAIMSNAGMDRGDLVIATALAALFGSTLMGLWANLPLAVAPAMGSNVIFTYVIVKQMGAPWQGALAMVAFTGVVFLVLSLSKLREKVAKDVPEALKVGIRGEPGSGLRQQGRRSHRAGDRALFPQAGRPWPDHWRHFLTLRNSTGLPHCPLPSTYRPGCRWRRAVCDGRDSLRPESHLQS
jgi:adenine/guanine/hypoxanthine permease